MGDIPIKNIFSLFLLLSYNDIFEKLMMNLSKTVLSEMFSDSQYSFVVYQLTDLVL